MEQAYLRPDVLPPSVPTFALAALAAVALAGWAVLHAAVARRFRAPRPRLAILVPAGTVACWTLLQFCARLLFLAGRGHLLFWALLSSACVETISWLYRREASRIKERRLRSAVVACRMAAAATMLFVLLQPVYVGERVRTIRRRVVVLMDDSASMHFEDSYWTEAGRLDVARALGALPVPEGGDPLEDSASRFSALAARFAEKAATLKSGAEDVAEDVAALVKETREEVAPVLAQMENLSSRIDKAKHSAESATLPRMIQFVRNQLWPALDELDSSVSHAAATRAGDALGQLAVVAPEVESAGALVAYDELDEDRRNEVLEASRATRASIARRLFSGKGRLAESPAASLSSRYDVDVYRFASSAEPAPALARPDSGGGAGEAGPAAPSGAADVPEGVVSAAEEDAAARETAFRSSTDLTHALETALSEIPFEEIAGFLLFTDGRHNGEAGVDAVARRIGGAGIPINTVVVGGTRPAVDVAIAEARAPESVFLGDKVRVAGSVSATGMRGKSVVVRLLLGDRELDATDPIYVETDDFVREFRFSDTPEEKGVRRYKVVADYVEGEEFPDNNDWTLDVSVTDDRTNVLLADDRPRWEFRYLRNLFYGRDKSVHLQEYLVHPDSVSGHLDERLPPASATRKFGDSESGSLPVNRAEWRKFDVIIMGDLDETVLTPEVAEELRYCVEERGALLVLIDGPRAMPHRIGAGTLRDLMPVEYDESGEDWVESPEPSYRLRLAPSGRGHEAMKQSTSSYENEQIWNDLPEFTWRHPVRGVKPGSEVLAWAEPKGAPELGTAARLAARDLQEDPEAAVRRLEEMRREQQVQSLVVAAPRGRGKVLQLNLDGTWRLRYRVGDTRHHKFWGQVLRWGAGEKLRAGNECVRLGTDQLRYTPADAVTIQARFQDSDFDAMDGLRPVAVVLDESGRELRSVRLRQRKDSNGFYEAETEPFPDPGPYLVRLSCPEAERALGDDFPRGLQTRFVVVTARRPAEFVGVSASFDVPERLARASGGEAVPPSRLPAVLDGYGEGNRTIRDRKEIFLWDSPAAFLLLLAFLTAEWIMRKRAGLN